MIEHNIELIKWAATAFITISALQVSFNVRWATEWWAYVGFLLGHILWTVAAIQMNELSLIVLNFAFILVDMYAMYIRVKPKLR